MLNQLQFKLQVEEQYKTGIEKMAQAYRAEGDKRLRNETDAKRVESDGKIQLLKKAKRRYETLAKFGGAVEDADGNSSSGFSGSPETDCLQSCSQMRSERRPCVNLSQANSSFPSAPLVT
jgi:classical protein kinase C/novel protein kinase C epsilon type